MVGPEARWGDLERLVALAVDYLADIWYMTAIDHMKSPPKRPKPIRRPEDVGGVDDETDSGTRTVNLSGREVITATSHTIEELDRLVEAQTGAPHGIAEEV